MIRYWTPAFSDLVDVLAQVSPDELDVRGVARRANVDLSLTPMPRTSAGAWEAYVSAAQGQERLLMSLTALEGRYRAYPIVMDAVRRSRSEVIASLANENPDSDASQLRVAVWRELERDINLVALAFELRGVANRAAAQSPGGHEIAAAADAAESGDGPATLSWTMRARALASATADKVGAPLLTELLKRLLL